MPQDFSRGHRLAQHGDSAVFWKSLNQLHEHPVGDIEVRLSRSGVEAAQALEVCLRGEIITSELPQLRIGNPWWVANDENSLLPRPEKVALPVLSEKVPLQG